MLQNEDVLRFDHDNKTYGLYRGADDKFYATDGLCTHGNAHLADGLVTGTIIECAKHNGRFELHDGSPQRLPVCVGLKTYPVRESNGRLMVDLTSAGGYGVTQAAPTATFRVLSNQNVAAFIKELVLVPAGDAALPDYQPGDYMQLDIPVYSERSLRDIEVNQPYRNTWQAQRVFDFVAANPTRCRRNYSLATNPSSDKTLKFNVRLATPPRRGLQCRNRLIVCLWIKARRHSYRDRPLRRISHQRDLTRDGLSGWRRRNGSAAVSPFLFV